MSGSRGTVGGMYAELDVVLTVKCLAPNDFPFACKSNCFN
jgi:hypothetical protein